MEMSFKLFTVFETVKLGGNFEIYKIGEKMAFITASGQKRRKNEKRKTKNQRLD